MKTFLLILQLLPGLFSAAKTIEQEAPVPAVGEAKASLLISIAQEIGDDIVPLIPLIAKTINHIVAFLKAVGIFK